MASPWMKFCLIIAFIIFANCVIIGIGFPVVNEDDEENQESACYKLLTTFKKKIKKLTQEVEMLKNDKNVRGLGFHYLEELATIHWQLWQIELRINEEKEEGYASGSPPQEEEGSAEGSATSCDNKIITKIWEPWITELTVRVQAVVNASKPTLYPTEETFTDQACPDGWAVYGQSCFHIIDTPTPNWYNARKMCQRLGGDLGKITTASENQFIYDLLRKQNTVTHYGVWIGLYRNVERWYFDWVDGTPLEGYTAWGDGEPNNSQAHGGENCVHKIGEKRNWPFKSGEWNDVPCSLSGIVPSQITPVVLCQKKMEKVAVDILSF